MAPSGVVSRGHGGSPDLTSGAARVARRKTAALNRRPLPQWAVRAAVVGLIAAGAGVAELSAHGVSGNGAATVERFFNVSHEFRKDQAPKTRMY